MDIVVQREALLKPLQAVSSVVEKKQTLPILSNVLLTTQEDHLLLTGTDLEVELIGRVPIESKSIEGMTTVSAKKLFDICRNLPEEMMLRLTLENNSLIVRARHSCFMLNTLPAQDFPRLEVSDYPNQFKLKEKSFKGLLAKTYFAMGQQDVRHYLNGTLLEIGHEVIKCVAADGHRLALATLNEEGIGEVEASVILPRKSVLELIRLLGNDSDDDMTVYMGENRLRITTTDYIFTTKLIHAQYPDYNRLVPKGTLSAVSDRESIKQALTRASILSNEKFRGVRFQLEPSKLRITANNSDQEQAEEALALDYAGSNMEIGFNVAYLLDAVSAIPDKMIRWVFTNPSEGVLIESVEDNHSLYVIMPMRL
jgi:DNA polymerase-3 subunit beta